MYLTGSSQSNTPSGSTPSGATPSGSAPSSTIPPAITPANRTPAASTPAKSSTPGASTQSAAKYANGADRNFHFGVSITPGLYWLSPYTNNDQGNGVGLGFSFGVNLEFYFTQNYGFVTGIDLANVPGNYTNTTTYSNASGGVDSTVSTKHQYSMQYVEIPLTFKFRTLPVGLCRYFAIVGFKPGIRTSATDNVTVTGSAGNTEINRSANDIDVGSQTSLIRLPYIFGAGLEYNIAGTTSLQAYLNYDAGMLNMNNTSSSKILSKGVTLTLGVLF